VSALGADEPAEDAQDRREAELLREGGAAALVEPPVQDRVGRAGVEAARARLADAELLGDLAVGRELGVREDDGRVAARPGLAGQEVQLEADRAEAGLDRHVARGQIAVARALHLPDGLLRRRLERPVVVLLEEARDPVADAIHLAQHELIDVVDARVVARAEGAGGDALEERDAAPDLGRDARRDLRVRGIGWVSVQDGGVSDADAVGAELARLGLDDLRGQRHALSWHSLRFAPHLGETFARHTKEDAMDELKVVRLDETEVVKFGPDAVYQLILGDDEGSTPIRTGIQTSQPGYVAPVHSHPYMEVLHILDGIAEAWVDGHEDSKVTLRKGDTIAIPPEVPHSFRVVGDEVLRLLGTHTSPRRIVSYKAGAKSDARGYRIFPA